MALLTFLASLGTGIVWNALYFIAERTHGFDQKSSLILAFANGVLYTGVALRAGWTVRLLERRMSPRAALGVVLLAQALLAPLVVIVPTEGVFWFVALTITGLGALQWPIVQHYLVSGRHGADMRNTIGWWNASWMLATAVGLAATGPLERYGLIEWAIPSLLPIYLLAYGCLLLFPRHPPAHDLDEQARHVPGSYRSLLASSRILHPMGYLAIGALAPILPYLFEHLKTQKEWQAPLGSVWHLARLAAVLVLWRTAFWHGRATTLVVAGVLLASGFAVAVASPSESALVVGLLALGAGQGIIYYNAIYYGLAVGAAEVDAGGIHEALVGAGYFVGPMLGLVALSLGHGPPVFIGLVLGALAVGFVAAIVRGRLAAATVTRA
jgi:hypothetical protein